MDFYQFLDMNHLAGRRGPRSAPGQGSLPRWEVAPAGSHLASLENSSSLEVWKTCFREKPHRKSNYCTHISIDQAFLMHIIIEMRIKKLR